MTHAEIIFALIVGIISALGVIAGAILTAYSGDRAAKLAFRGVERQVALTYAVKMAEFRQGWINDLREAMAGFHSVAIMPGSLDKREFYRLGTKIELLMNRTDPRYGELVQCMYDFLMAESREEKWSCNAPFVTICQDVLKTEWEVLKRELATANLPVLEAKVQSPQTDPKRAR
jgi:hypothetical protein